MPIRLTGINSGLDTDTIIQALVSSYSVKKQSYEKKQTKLNWTMDAWKGLNSKVYSLYTNVSKLKYQSAYAMNKTTVSDNTKATVTASNSAVKGTQTLKIDQIAQSGYLTGGKMKVAAKSNSTLASLGYAADSSEDGGSAKFNVVRGNGDTTEISVSATDTVDNVLSKLKDAGLNATLDTSNNRIFISAKETGEASDFDLIATNGNGSSLLSTLGLRESLGSYDAATGTTDYTETGKLYSKYAAFDKGSESATSSHLDTLATEYNQKKEASAKYAAQISNLTDGISYEKAYKELNAFYADKNISNTSQFNSAMTAADGSLVDDSGNVYTNTSQKDTNGNEVYSYTGNDNVTHYLAKIDNQDGTYSYKEADKAVSGYKDSDGKAAVYDFNTDSYKVTKDDGTEVEYTKNAEGKYVNNDGKELVPEYKYEAGANAVSVVTAESIKSVYTEEERNSFVANYNTVTNFEKQAQLESSQEGQEPNSKTKIVEAVKDGQSIDFATEIKNASDAKDTADTYMEENSLISGLASKVGTSDYDAALASMTKMVSSAAEAIKPDNLAGAGATKVKGQDAIIYLNGAEFKSSSNTIAVNGLTINAKAATGGQEITINTETDVQGIYDKIKDFLTEYNSVINEMCSLYNADSAKGFEPLTDDEKDAMSDSEVEKWEQKIKDSLLRKDDTLNGVINAMTTSMFQSYEVNGKKYSLSSFGISTLGYMNSAKNEHYAYHIDGDEDDENTSGKTDRLMTAISNEPDTVISFMKQLASNLYTAIGDKMSRTSLSSSYTIYNDKQMTKQLTEYKSLISKWEEKLSEKEDYYYKKFAAMESAMAKLNSTQSSMGGFFG